MPADTKCKCTESTRKCEGRESTKADKHDRENRKIATKAHKTRRKEAKEDDLLVEHEGESSDVSQLCVLAIRLESDNQRMRAQLMRQDKQAQLKPCKLIPEPEKLSLVDVKLIHTHLDCLGEEHDLEWFQIRGETRDCLKSGGLAWGVWWLKQDMDCCNTIVHVLENHVPKLKMFANHWAAIFLLKECHNNMHNYKRDVNGSSTMPDSSSADHAPTSTSSSRDDSHADNSPTDNHSQADEDASRACKVAARKASLQRAVERKALKLRAWAEVDAEQEGTMTKCDTPANDGDTEMEDLLEEVRKTIEQEEIGVPAGSQTPLKPVPKAKCAHSDNQLLPAKKRVVLEPEVTTTTQGKRRPIIFMRCGHGGKVTIGHGQSHNVGKSCSAADAPEDDQILSLSGQSGSSDDD
ncbi:hypothetical protein FRC11_013907, partial [Ceratobasidium sp. 423]